MHHGLPPHRVSFIHPPCLPPLSPPSRLSVSVLPRRGRLERTPQIHVRELLAPQFCTTETEINFVNLAVCKPCRKGLLRGIFNCNRQKFSLSLYSSSLGTESFCVSLVPVYCVDECCFCDFLLRTLTRNIRERRGEKVAMNVPSNATSKPFGARSLYTPSLPSLPSLPLSFSFFLSRPLSLSLSSSSSSSFSTSPSVFKDTNTPSPFVEKFPTDIDGTGSVRAKPDHVYLDCMGFGMGCSCLQVCGTHMTVM